MQRVQLKCSYLKTIHDYVVINSKSRENLQGHEEQCFIDNLCDKYPHLLHSFFISLNMAQIKNSIKSEGGLCEKIHKAVSPFRSRNRHHHHRHQGHESDHLLPVEFNHLSAQNTKKLVAPSPAVQSAGKENASHVNRVQEFDDREILIIRGQRFVKRAPEEKIAPTARHKNPASAPGPTHALFRKVRSYKDDELAHEGTFAEYISKVKNRMMKTESNVGGGGVERSISFK